MSDISERVKKIVVEHLGVEADKVVDSASFVDEIAEKITTIKDAIEHIEKSQN